MLINIANLNCEADGADGVAKRQAVFRYRAAAYVVVPVSRSHAHSDVRL